MIKKALYIFIGSTLLLGILFWSIWLNISSSSLTPWVENEINSNIPPIYKVKIVSVETKIWGLRIESLKLINTQLKKEIVKINEFDLNLNLLSVLFSFGIPFDVDLYNGNLEGVYRFFPDQYVKLSGNDIQINKNNFLKSTKLILSNPKLELKGKVVINKNYNADLEIIIPRIKLSGKTDDTKLPFKFPNINLSQLRVNLKLLPNKISVDFKSGGDIKAILGGSIIGNLSKLDRSNINMTLTAEFEKKYYKNLGFIKDILSGYMNKSGKIKIRIAGRLMSPSVKKL